MPSLNALPMPPGKCFQMFFSSHVSTVSQFLNQPDGTHLAKVLTWIRMLRLDTA